MNTISRLEKQLAIPVFSSNTASLWYMLKLGNFAKSSGDVDIKVYQNFARKILSF